MMKITKKGQPWTLRRLGKLSKAGYLLKDTKRREHRYYIPDDLPGGAVPVLPAPELVAAWMAEPEEHQDPPPREPEEPGTLPEFQGPIPFDGMAFN
jgi:hypothetical protein